MSGIEPHRRHAFRYPRAGTGIQIVGHAIGVEVGRKDKPWTGARGNCNVRRKCCGSDRVVAAILMNISGGIDAARSYQVELAVAIHVCQCHIVPALYHFIDLGRER